MRLGLFLLIGVFLLWKEGVTSDPKKDFKDVPEHLLCTFPLKNFEQDYESSHPEYPANLRASYCPPQNVRVNREDEIIPDEFQNVGYGKLSIHQRQLDQYNKQIASLLFNKQKDSDNDSTDEIIPDEFQRIVDFPSGYLMPLPH